MQLFCVCSHACEEWKLYEVYGITERDAVQCGRKEKLVTSIFCEKSYAISSYLTNPAKWIYIPFSELVTQRFALENSSTTERREGRSKKEREKK